MRSKFRKENSMVGVEAEMNCVDQTTCSDDEKIEN